VKRCGNPSCGQVDDGLRPVRVEDMVLTLDWGAEPTVISGPLCSLCRHDLVAKLGAFLPFNKVRQLNNDSTKASPIVAGSRR